MGAETHTPHIQGYVFFSAATTVAVVCRRLGGRASVHVCNGTPLENRAYCSKTDGTEIVDTFVERGTLPGGQGNRQDLNAFQESLERGDTRQQLWREHFPYMLRHHRAVSAYFADNPVTRSRMPRTVVLFGPTGTGKSAYIFGRFPSAYPLTRSSTGVWFDGYDGRQHRELLIDEFYGWIPFDLLLRLLDRYRMYVDTKGGRLGVGDWDVYITTNTPITEWYGYNYKMNYNALRRRIGEYWLCGMDVWSRVDVPDLPVFVQPAVPRVRFVCGSTT